MRDAVIVSTARTGIGKAYRGAPNMFDGSGEVPEFLQGRKSIT